MKKQTISLAIGTAFVAGAALSPVAQAADNPFGMQKLDAGYQLAEAKTEAKAKDGKCGEGKCGAANNMADMKQPIAKKTEAKKPAAKAKDGSCGADKKAAETMAADKKKDGSCGAKK